MEQIDPSVLFDHSRQSRIGLPEAVLAEGKPFEVLQKLLDEFKSGRDKPILFTRLKEEIFQKMPEGIRGAYDYHSLSRTAFSQSLAPKEKGRVAVVSAGSADGAVTWEAARTLEYLGIRRTVYEDSGVAGLWRLSGRLEEINGHEVIIVVAGLDAALASVLGGLTPKPIFAVPTSIGYGLARGGESALSSMLVSCAPGVSVLNIDNGYGAAAAAARVINLLNG